MDEIEVEIACTRLLKRDIDVGARFGSVLRLDPGGVFRSELVVLAWIAFDERLVNGGFGVAVGLGVAVGFAGFGVIMMIG